MSGHHNHNHHAEKKRVALISLLASFGLSLAKFAAALFTGSLGMLSEAMHSLVDMCATMITWFAISWSDQPADDDHHFGHAKVESVAALFEAGLLIGIAVFIAYEAVLRLLSGNSDVEVTWWAVGILILSMIVDFNRSRALSHTAEVTASAALAADAKHFESDMWSSLAALIGLCGVWWGWQWTDAVAGLLVSVYITFIGWGLGKNTLASLLDKAPEGAAEDIRKVADKIDGVLSVNQLRVRQVGRVLFISVVADVPRMMAITSIVAIKDQLTAEIQAKYPLSDVAVTANPVAVDSESAFDKISLIAAQRGLAIHHLTVQQISGRLAVSFDLEVEGATPLKKAHAQATALEDAIRNSLGADVEVESHIEPQPLRLVDGKAADAKTAKSVEASLRRFAKVEKSLSDLHNVRVRLTGGGLFVHYHCRFAPSQTIDIVHAVVDRIENALQKRHPDIKRVVAHAEPVGQARHQL
jgi:cation diffusion facilitator family transporter